MKPTSRIRSLALTLAAVLAFACTTATNAAEPIRIRAGTTEKHTDESGVMWLADQGFVDGDTIDRTGIAVANTKTPSLYGAERYGMSAFSLKVPNGKYTVKLHFAETYEGISGAGERVFSFKVEGKEFKDFDVTAKAGGTLRAYVETVEVEVADGKLDIGFTSKTENPEINALEIIPAS
jgi:endoglucanase